MQRTARMKRELAMFAESPPFGISCWSKDDNLEHLEAQILGGDSTPYKGGVFKLDITIPERYPFEPPKILFVTPVYHPNIDTAGRICLDSLKMPPKGAWRPALNVCSLLTTIQLLMAEPNPDDPLMMDIANEFKYNRPQFEATARHWTEQHATSGRLLPLPKSASVENMWEDNGSFSRKRSSATEPGHCDLPLTDRNSKKIKF